MDKYSNRYHPEFVPGTFSIYADQLDPENKQLDDIVNVKTTADGTILLPQPSDSVNDPLNWSYWRKALQYVMLLYFTALTAATSNSAGSAQDGLNETYGIGYTAMNSGAGILFISIGYGCLLLAPITSLYGRKVNYIVGILLSIIGCFWFGSADKTSDALWSQLFVGASEAPSEAVAQLSITDILYQHNLGSGLTGYIMAISIGTYLGPLIGGIEADYLTFHAVGNIGGFISIGTLIFFLFFFEETYFDRSKFMPISNYTIKTIFSKDQDPAPLLESFSTTPVEAKQDGTEEEDNKDSAEPSSSKEKSTNLAALSSDHLGQVNVDTGKNDTPHSLWRRLKLFTPSSNLKGTGFKQYFKLLWINIKMCAFPAVILSGVIWGWEDALLTFYLTTEDDLYYDDPWDYSDTQVGVMNLPCLIGAIIGCFLAGSISDYYVQYMARRNGGVGEAEYRLHFAIFPAIIAPIGYILFGLGTQYTWNWRPIYIGLGFIGFGWGCSGDIAMGYLMDAYPEMVLEGMVGVSVVNNTIGCIFTFVCSYWEDSAGNQNTYISVAVLKFASMVACVPFILWGKKWREQTKDRYIKYIEERDGI